jgi:hypothetical protein
MIFTLPLTLTLGGDIQYILFYFNLFIANTVPIVIAAGNAGGTVIVIRSNDLSTISNVLYPYDIITGKVIQNPKNANRAIHATKIKESL